MATQIGLSKSKLLEFLQCPKKLYLSVHHSDLKSESGDMQARFAIGHEVGRYAQQLYPEGVMIGDERNNLTDALVQTKKELQAAPSKPIFEATFQNSGVLIRADILVPQDDGYQVIEVKSSTGVKDQHIDDCAIQSWVAREAGVNVKSVHVMHIDNSFLYKGDSQYIGLLALENISQDVYETVHKVPQWISEAQAILAGAVPDKSTGSHCHSPYECPFLGHCDIGKSPYSIDLLPKSRGPKIIELLKSKGYEDLREVPEGLIDSEILEKIRRVTVSGVAELDSAVMAIMQLLPYPRYYLDFETIQFAIPIWAETRPYQQLPFQWSCHIETEDGSLLHHEFLDISGQAPMRAFTESLIRHMGTEGPVLVYNQAFEKGRMEELALRFPEFSSPLRAIIGRVVDLLPLARNYYYHPEMKGSWSIKAVLPTVAPELDYSFLEDVQNGGHAQLAFLEATSEKTDQARKDRLYQALLTYCKQDTYAMVVLGRFFTRGKI